jgi:hypothetical protein
MKLSDKGKDYLAGAGIGAFIGLAIFSGPATWYFLGFIAMIIGMYLCLMGFMWSFLHTLEKIESVVKTRKSKNGKS